MIDISPPYVVVGLLLIILGIVKPAPSRSSDSATSTSRRMIGTVVSVLRLLLIVRWRTTIHELRHRRPPPDDPDVTWIPPVLLRMRTRRRGTVAHQLLRRHRRCGRSRPVTSTAVITVILLRGVLLGGMLLILACAPLRVGMQPGRGRDAGAFHRRAFSSSSSYPTAADDPDL